MSPQRTSAASIKALASPHARPIAPLASHVTSPRRPLPLLCARSFALLVGLMLMPVVFSLLGPIMPPVKSALVGGGGGGGGSGGDNRRGQPSQLADPLSPDALGQMPSVEATKQKQPPV